MTLPNNLHAYKGQLQNENRRFAIQRFVFNPEYFTFMEILLHKTKPTTQLLKITLTFLLNCAIRENSRQWV
jgi:hypothetical protein